MADEIAILDGFRSVYLRQTVFGSFMLAVFKVVILRTVRRYLNTTDIQYYYHV